MSSSRCFAARLRGNFATSRHRAPSVPGNAAVMLASSRFEEVGRGILSFWLSLGQLHCSAISLKDRIQRNCELRPGSGPVKLGGESLELQIPIGAVFKVAI